MKLKQIYEACTKGMEENEEIMSAEQIEDALDIIQNETNGNNPEIADLVKKVDRFVRKKDLVSATKTMETLMNKVRDLNT